MKLRLLLVTALLFSVSASAKKPKRVRQPQPPTQEAITKGCVTVSDIYSHTRGLAFKAGLQASVQNNCGQTVEVFVRIGYFDGRGVQIGYDIATATVASGARYSLNHVAFTLSDSDQWYHKVSRIIAVEAYLI